MTNTITTLLYEHEDGRYAVNPDTTGDPGWHRLGPVDLGALAAQDQEAEPIAEICSASHDAAEFGERAIRPLRTIDSFDYGTKLYAGHPPRRHGSRRRRPW